MIIGLPYEKQVLFPVTTWLVTFIFIRNTDIQYIHFYDVKEQKRIKWNHDQIV
jgi:hypothetical protein